MEPEYTYELISLSDFPRLDESLTISERGNHIFDVPTDIEVLGYNIATGEQTWAQPSSFSIHPDINLNLVRFTDGDFMFVADTDSMLCYTDNGVEVVDTKDTVNRFCPFTTEDFLQHIEIKDTVEVSGKEGNGRGKWKEKQFELPLNYQTGQFLGLVLGDGWVDNRDVLYLAGSTEDKKENRQLFKDLCGSACLPYKNKCGDIDRVSESINGKMTSRGKTRATCAWFNRWLRGEVGKGAFNKKIPTFCFTAPEEHLLGLLDGLISSDGSVLVGKTSFHIRISTSSVYLLTGLRILCKRLGLLFASYPSKSKVSGKDTFTFSIRGSSFKQFFDKGFEVSHKTKQSRVKQGLKITSGESFDFTNEIPFPPVRIEEELFACLEDLPNYDANEIRRRLRDKRMLKNYARQINTSRIATSIDWQDYFAITCNEEVVWKKVKSVTPLQEKQTAYDLTLPNIRGFCVVSGAATRNSDGDQLNVHVPSTEAAKEEAKAKLLPSKNLLNVKTFEPIMIPSNEAALGINLANRNKPNRKKVLKFPSLDELEKAFFNGDVDLDDPVEISN